MHLHVARIGKPHGIRGEVTVQVFTDDPEARFAPGEVLSTEPEANGPLTVASARWNKRILVLGFEEVPDRNRAEELRGTQLFFDPSDLEEEEGDDEGWYEHDLVGMKAVVDGTQVGEVTELVTGAAQDLLVIRLTSGTEAMVPFVEQIVPTIDEDAGTVTLTPPPGLLDLAGEN
ncbi:ribosome maturation factor RimM [Galactobacter sp.]|uniref:ribosome maturation factor RimM n=1 Tax=Galactobacter sp. TaxID=2676125 RepID=UPI0025BA12DA|nr:ribosome maturation factor RimM [Galactobacter sp.]